MPGGDKFVIPEEHRYLGEIDRSFDVQSAIGSVGDQLAALRRALADLDSRTLRWLVDVQLTETSPAGGIGAGGLAERSRLEGEHRFEVTADQILTLRLIGDFRRRYLMPCTIFGFFEVDPPGEGAHVSFAAMDHSLSIAKDFSLAPGEYVARFQLRAYTHRADQEVFDDTFNGWSSSGTYAQVSAG